MRDVAQAARLLGFPDWTTEAAHMRVKRAIKSGRTPLDGYQEGPGSKWWVYLDSIEAYISEIGRSVPHSLDCARPTHPTDPTRSTRNGEECSTHPTDPTA